MPLLLTLFVLLLVGAGSFLAMVLRRLEPKQRLVVLLWTVAPLGLLATLVLVARFGVGGLAPAAVAIATGRRRLGAFAAGWPLLSRLARWLVQGRGGAASSGSGQASGSSSGGTRPGRRRMSRQEALRVLGLEEGASPQDVQREYRRLMKRLHPDQGGSTYLAAQVNEAHDVLIA